MIHVIKWPHFMLIFGAIVFGSVYMVLFSKDSPKFLGHIALNMIVYFYVFKAVKDLSRIFFKKMTDDLHSAIIN